MELLLTFFVHPCLCLCSSELTVADSEVEAAEPGASPRPGRGAAGSSDSEDGEWCGLTGREVVMLLAPCVYYR